jgi:anti-sigma-K factor RskA
LAWTGWLAAAACVAFLLSRGPEDPRPGRVPEPMEMARRLAADPEVLRVAFGPGSSGEGGEVLWSTRRQEGVLALRGIRPNDPTREQYQLWIVDPQRDAKFPVDGGVFDVTSDGTVVIPVDAKLPILGPTAFVITREQPGGVVKSQAEKPVLVASVR